MAAGWEDQTRTFYEQRGFRGRIGFGQNPALVLVDFMRSFTDPAYPPGANMDNEIAATRRVLDAARQAGIPVIYMVIAYQSPQKEAPHFLAKMPALEVLLAGTDAVEVDPRIAPLPGETVITKKFASAFFGTPLHSQLAANRVDTVLLVGCTTSGCIRASAIDAVQHGYRAIVIRECVADRAQGPHEANLFDIDAKYGDVVSVDEVIEYLESLPKA